MKQTAVATLLVLALVLIPTAGRSEVCDLDRYTVTMCDNFGKVWVLELSDGEISGYRNMIDPGSDCGELPVYGTVCCPQNKVRMAVLDTPEDECIATFWEGKFTTRALNVIEGEVWNEKGFFGPFTLVRCDGKPGSGGASDIDPAKE